MGLIEHDDTGAAVNNEPINYLKFGKTIYSIALACYIALTLLADKTAAIQIVPPVMFSIGKYLCLAIIVTKIAICRDFLFYSKSDWVKIVIITTIILIVSYCSNSRLPLQYWIIVLGAFRLNFHDVARCVLIVESITLFSVILLALLGVIPAEYTVRSNGRIRYSLGFEFATYPAILFYYLSCLYLCLKKDAAGWRDYIVILTLNSIMYVLTDTRTEILLVLLFIVAHFLIGKFQNSIIFGKVLFFAGCASMIMSCIVSLIFAVTYTPDNPMLKAANSALSGRLALSHRGLNEYGISPFGTEIEWNTLEEIKADTSQQKIFNVVDNGYMNVTYNYGYVLLSMMMLGYFLATKEINANKNSYLILAVVILAIHTFLTPQWSQIIYNIYLILLTPIVIKGGADLRADFYK